MPYDPNVATYTLIAAIITATSALIVGILTRRHVPRESVRLRREAALEAMDSTRPIVRAVSDIVQPWVLISFPTNRAAELRDYIDQLETLASRLYVIGEDGTMQAVVNFRNVLREFLSPTAEPFGDYDVRGRIGSFGGAVQDAAREAVAYNGQHPGRSQRSQTIWRIGYAIFIVSTVAGVLYPIVRGIGLLGSLTAPYIAAVFSLLIVSGVLMLGSMAFDISESRRNSRASRNYRGTGA